MTNGMDERISNPAGGRKRLLRIGAGAAGLVLVAALAAVVLGGPARSARIDRDAVTIATVEDGVFRDFTTLQGKIAARDTIYLDAQEGGQVQKILVEAGDRVVTGQPLVELRNSELELEVLSQEGRLVESITQLQAYGKELEQNRAENERALARIDYDVLRLSRQVERRERLLAQGYVPREHVDQLRDELNYNSKLRPLQAQTNRRQETLRLAQLPHIATELASLQESLRITRAKLGDLIVKAPVAGRLTAIDLKVGQNRNRGDRLAEITLNTGFKIVAEVDQFYLNRVQVGQFAEAPVQGRARKLIVRRVYPQVRNGTFTVDLDFAGDAPNDLSAGEAVFGKLSLGRDHKATVLKAGPYLQGSNGSWVFVLNRAGTRAERRTVALGRRNADVVEVKSGLKPGEQVLVSSYDGYEKMDRLNLNR